MLLRVEQLVERLCEQVDRLLAVTGGLLHSGKTMAADDELVLAI